MRLTTAARAKAVAGLDEVARAALERAEEAQQVEETTQYAAAISRWVRHVVMRPRPVAAAAASG